MRTSIHRIARRLASWLLPLVVAGPLLAQPVLTGQVLGPDGEPLSAARVELAPMPSFYEAGRLRLEGQGLPPAVAVAESDPSGRFRLQVPRAGVWRVVVHASGRVPMWNGPLLVLEPEELPPVNLLPDLGARVQVVDEEGRAVKRVWAVATSEDDGVPESRRTGGWQPEHRAGLTAEDGSVTLPRFAEERLRVSVHPPGRAEESLSGFVRGTLRLTPASQESRALRVTTPKGKPVPGVLVRSGSALWPVGVTDSEGVLRLPIREGEPARGFLFAPDGRQQAFHAGSRGEVESVVLRPGLRVRGKVLDAHGKKGLADAWLWPAADPATPVRTDREGRYALTASAGQRLVLVAKAAGYLPRRLVVPAADLAKGRGPTVELERAAELGGAVLGPDGKPLSGVTVEAFDTSKLGPRAFSELDPVSDRAATGLDGRFRLRQLRAGQGYELRASRRGYFPAAMEVATPAPGSRPPSVQVHLRSLCGVHGTIEDSQARPLAGAKIALTPARRIGPAGDRRPVPDFDPADTVTAESDPDGRFAVPAPPAEEVDLEVRKRGFAPTVRRSVHLAAPCPGSIDLGTLVVRPGARLAGQVVSRNGQDVSGAEVFLVDRLPPRTEWLEALRERVPDASTDGAGRFVLENLPPGVAKHLLVRAPGHLVAAARGVRPPLDDALVIRMEPSALLRGRVLDARDAAVSGARVALDWQRVLPEDPRKRPIGEPILRSTASDVEGRFEIPDVPEGEVSLHVTARGFVPVEGETVRLPRPDSAEELVVVLRDGAGLEGRVTTEAGDAVASVRLSIGGHTTSSDAEGAYSLDGIAAGEQELHVFHPHHGALLRTVWIDEGVNYLDIELEAGFEVSGRVVDEAGRPVSAAEVALTPEKRGGIRLHETRTGENGRFRLESVQGGRYRLEARAAGFATGTLPAPLVVSDQPVEGVEVVLRPGAVIGGWVLGLSPEELAAVEVTAHLPAGRSRRARVDSEGRFEVRELSPGDWLLRAGVWDGQREVEARVPVAPSDRWLRQDLEFGRRLTLSGRVLLGEEPLPGGHVSLRGERFAAERSVVTGFDGRFLFEDLEPDQYWLGVKDSNRLLVHNQTLELAHDLDLEVRLETATIAGFVQDEATGAPIPDALLSLRPTEGPSFLFTDSTLPDGSFRLLQVPPGTYRLTATARGRSPAERQVSVAPGDRVEDLELVLEGTSGLELHVRLASGETPSMLHVLARDGAGAPVLAGSFTVAPSGNTELSTLPAGDWQLTVGASGGATTTRRVTVPGEPVAITLPPAADLHVQVPALARENLLATVRLVRADQEPFWKLGPGGSVERSWTLRGGKGVVEAVPAGLWSVVAEASDGRSWVGSVAISGTGEALISLE